MRDYSSQQQERLAHIEFMGRFYGTVSRKDISDRFGISDAAATRDFQAYNHISPDNLVYQPSIRRYVWQEGAQPFFEIDTEKALSTLVYGFGDSLCVSNNEILASSTHLTDTNINLVAVLTRAIKRKIPVQLNYLSKSTPKGALRVIVPHSIVNSGLRWHVRAYDRKRKRFTDFVINRIKEAKSLPREAVSPEELVKSDNEWNEFIELILQPHPKKSDIKNLIEFEYNMTSGELRKPVRKALAGYLLDTWNIDVSEDAHVTGPHIFLHLKNTTELIFESKKLAPGATT